MLRFTEEQETIRKLIRRWPTSKLEPKLDALETGAPPYELMRDFARQFGIADLARSACAKIEQRAKAGADAPAKPAKKDSGMGIDAALAAIVSIELSRVSPGFAFAFGASAGLAGGALMGTGTLEQQRRWGLPILAWGAVGAW